MKVLSPIMTGTSRSFLKGARGQLAEAGIESFHLESELLLAAALDLRREDLHIHPDRVLSEEEFRRASELVRRRLCREPVAHILGRREFWGLEFKITPGVLVPRWETEILIERFLHWVRSIKRGRSLRILDLGTGSGNIAVVLAKEIPDCRVTAVDISSAALEVAAENAKIHGVADRIQLHKLDLISDNWPGVFDAIVSNPPYIMTRCLETLMPEVRNFESREALDGGPDGLEFYRRIVSRATNHLTAGGMVFFEIGEDQGPAVFRLLEEKGSYGSPVISKDYSGFDRVVVSELDGNG